jgi:hypothetical protein
VVEINLNYHQREQNDMANYSRQTLMRIGRLLHAGNTGHLRKLAEFSGFGPKAVYNWTLDETDAQYRNMPPPAKRMVAMLTYFGAAGLLNEERLKDVVALEAALEHEQEAQAVLRRLRGAVRLGGARAAGPAAVEPAESPPAAK